MDNLSPPLFVQGASRGIGLELVAQLLARRPRARVFASFRDPKGAVDLQALASIHGDRLRPLALDVTQEASIAAAAARWRWFWPPGRRLARWRRRPR